MKNEIEIVGKITDSRCDHTSHGRNIYVSTLEYVRPSGTVDHFSVLYDGSIKVPDAPYCRIDGDLRERTMDTESENVIHAYTFHGCDSPEYINDVLIEGEIVRHGRVRFAKNVPFIQTVIRSNRVNGTSSDYIKVTVFGKDAYEINESGKGRVIKAFGRMQQLSNGTQVTARGIEWK